MNGPRRDKSALQKEIPLPVISIVIATFNDERRLVPTLASLVSGAADGLIVEAIIADGGSADDTEAVADVAGCRFVRSPDDRGRRLTQAGLAAKAPWLLFMAPGAVLDEGWIRDVRSFLETVTRRGETDRRAAIFSIGSDGYDLSDRMGLVKARAAFALGFGPHPVQGLLISAPFYRALGGHPRGDTPERALARRIGRRHTTVLRSRATAIGT